MLKFLLYVGAGISRIIMPNPSIVAYMVSEITAFIQTDGHG